MKEGGADIEGKEAHFCRGRRSRSHDPRTCTPLAGGAAIS